MLNPEDKPGIKDRLKPGVAKQEMQAEKMERGICCFKRGLNGKEIRNCSLVILQEYSFGKKGGIVAPCAKRKAHGDTRFQPHLSTGKSP